MNLQRPGACLTFDRRWRAQTTAVRSPRRAPSPMQAAAGRGKPRGRVAGWGTLAETGHRGLAPGTHGNVTPQGRDDALGRKSRKDCDLLLLAYCPLVMNSRRSMVNPQQTPLDISLAANDETEWIGLFSKFFCSPLPFRGPLGSAVDKPTNCPTIVLRSGHFPSAGCVDETQSRY